LIIQHLAAYTVLWKCRCGGLKKSRFQKLASLEYPCFLCCRRSQTYSSLSTPCPAAPCMPTSSVARRLTARL